MVVGFILGMFTGFLAKYFLPWLVFLLMPNKQKLFFSTLAIFIILYGGMSLYFGTYKLDAIVYSIWFLPIVLAKYIAVRSAEKNNKPSAPNISAFIFVWPFFIFYLLANDSVSDVLEENSAFFEDGRVLRSKHIRVGEVDYDIPAEFKGLGFTKDLSIYDVKVMMPDFTPLQRSEKYLRRHGMNKQIVRLVAHDPAKRANLEKMAKGIGVTNKHAGKKFGLEFYKQVDDRKLYIGRDGKKRITTVMHCGEETNPNAGCNHYFTDGQLNYDAYYSLVYLQDWQMTEEKTRALFEQFRVRAKEKGLDRVEIPDKDINPRLKQRAQ